MTVSQAAEVLLSSDSGQVSLRQAGDFALGRLVCHGLACVLKASQCLGVTTREDATLDGVFQVSGLTMSGGLRILAKRVLLAILLLSWPWSVICICFRRHLLAALFGTLTDLHTGSSYIFIYGKD